MFFVSILQLIRWKNILILLVSQLLFYAVFYPSLLVKTQLSPFLFSALTLSTIFIAAGGYIINDLFDVHCDRINKPLKTLIGNSISKKTGLILYIFFTIIGLVLGIFLSIQTKNQLGFLVFPSIILLLFLYSYQLQKLPLIGNVVVSVLVASNILILELFDPAISFNNTAKQFTYLFVFFIFEVNFLREIIKDIEDLKGDYNVKMKTLPILLGIKRTKKLAFIFSLFVLVSLIQFCVHNSFLSISSKIAFGLFVVLPFVFFQYKLYSSIKKKQFQYLSTFLKGILFLGMLFILYISFYNVIEINSPI